MRRALLRVRRERDGPRRRQVDVLRPRRPERRRHPQRPRGGRDGGPEPLRHLPRAGQGRDGYVDGDGRFPGPSTKNGPDEDWIAASPVKREDGATGAVLVTGWTYRFFARHLQESLKTGCSRRRRRPARRARSPSFTSPSSTSRASTPRRRPAGRREGARRAGPRRQDGRGPRTGTLTITDRPFGLAARAPRSSRRTRASSCCAASRSRSCCPSPFPPEAVDPPGERRPAEQDERRRRPSAACCARSTAPVPSTGAVPGRREPERRSASPRRPCSRRRAHGQFSCSARRRTSRVASSSFCSAAMAVDVCCSPERSSCM